MTPLAASLSCSFLRDVNVINSAQIGGEYLIYNKINIKWLLKLSDFLYHHSVLVVKQPFLMDFGVVSNIFNVYFLLVY